MNTTTPSIPDVGIAHIYIQACLAGDSIQSDPMPHWVTSRQQLYYISVSTVVNEASTYYLKYIALTASSMPYNSLVMADSKKIKIRNRKMKQSGSKRYELILGLRNQ